MGCPSSSWWSGCLSRWEDWGVRNQEQLRYAAFVGAVEQCVPHIGVSTGLCPALAQQFSGDECFGRGMRSARVLTEEYRKKARNVVRVYGGADEGTVGRVQRKLLGYGEVRGLVFGAFGEASEGVHELVHHLANSRLVVSKSNIASPSLT